MIPAPASHPSDHILELEPWPLKAASSQLGQRESSVFPFHFIFLINPQPAPPREHFSNEFFFFSSEGSWKKNQNTFACYLKHFKPVSYLCHCTVFSFQCWYFYNYSHLQPQQFLFEKVILNRGQKKSLGNTAEVCFSIVFSSQSSEISRKPCVSRNSP